MRGMKSLGFILFTILFCFSAQATSESEVVVKLGKGRAEVQSYGFEFPGNWRQKMETDLMTDRNLADRVVSSATTEVRLGGRALDEIEAKLTSEPEAAIEDLEKMVRLQVLGTSRSNRGSGGTELGDENRRVVVGGRFELKEGESLEELVILGGQAEVRGKVGRLSVMGGRVHLYPTAEVSDELVNVGGEIKIEPGAKVEGEPYEVSTPFDQSFRFFFNSHDDWNPVEFFKDGSVVWGMRIIKLVMLVLISMVLVQLAPDFFAETQNNLEKSVPLSVAWGVGYFLAYVPVAIVLTITIVGLSLLPVQFLFTMYLMVVGCAAAMTFLLRKWGVAQQKPLMAQVALAVVVLELLGWIPFFGTAWHVLITAVGAGAAFQVIWRRMWKKKTPMTPVLPAQVEANH